MACPQTYNQMSHLHRTKHAFALKTFFFLLLLYYFPANAQQDTTLKNTLPAQGKMINDKPVGKGWVNMLSPGQLAF